MVFTEHRLAVISKPTFLDNVIVELVGNDGVAPRIVKHTTAICFIVHHCIPYLRNFLFLNQQLVELVSMSHTHIYGYIYLYHKQLFIAYHKTLQIYVGVSANLLVSPVNEVSKLRNVMTLKNRGKMRNRAQVIYTRN